MNLLETHNRVYVPDRMGRMGMGSWVDAPTPFGYKPPMPSQGWAGLKPSSSFTLNAAVGEQALNRPNDVAKIEQHLGHLGLLDTAKTNGPTGYYGERLKQAIAKFQTQNGLSPDGMLTTNGPTLAALQAQLAPAKPAQKLQNKGRKGDTVLAHLSQSEAEFLHSITDGASINPKTGLLEFNVDDFSDMPDSDFSAPDNSSLDSDMSEAIDNAYNNGSPGTSHDNASGPEYGKGVNLGSGPSGFKGSGEEQAAPEPEPKPPSKTPEEKAFAKARATTIAVHKKAEDDEAKAELKAQEAAAKKSSKSVNLLDDGSTDNMTGPELDWSDTTVTPATRPADGESGSGIDYLTPEQKTKNKAMDVDVKNVIDKHEKDIDKWGYVAPEGINLPPPSVPKDTVPNILLQKVIGPIVGDPIAAFGKIFGRPAVNPITGKKLTDEEALEEIIGTLITAGTLGVGVGIKAARAAYKANKAAMAVQVAEAVKVAKAAHAVNGLKAAKITKAGPISLKKSDHPPKSLSNLQTRALYKGRISEAKKINDRITDPKVGALDAHQVRNQVRTLARSLMEDREAAADLDRKHPNRTYEEMVNKAKNDGLTGEYIEKSIRESAFRTNPIVDKKY